VSNGEGDGQNLPPARIYMFTCKYTYTQMYVCIYCMRFWDQEGLRRMGLAMLCDSMIDFSGARFLQSPTWLSVPFEPSSWQRSLSQPFGSNPHRLPLGWRIYCHSPLNGRQIWHVTNCQYLPMGMSKAMAVGIALATGHGNQRRTQWNQCNDH